MTRWNKRYILLIVGLLVFAIAGSVFIILAQPVQAADHLSFSKVCSAEGIAPGRTFTLTIRFTNTSNQTQYGLYIREYVPAYCLYVSHSGGSYGAIQGKEHVTLFMPEIGAKQTVTIQMNLRMNVCTPDTVVLNCPTYYEITGSRDTIQTNDPQNPAELGNSIQMSYRIQ